MVKKIEIKELFNLNEQLIIIDLENKNITCIRNQEIIDSEQLYLNISTITNLVKDNIIGWDNLYVDNSNIDGIKVELKFYIDNEIIDYMFKNKFPSNYDVFIKKLKEMVNVSW